MSRSARRANSVQPHRLPAWRASGQSSEEVQFGLFNSGSLAALAQQTTLRAKTLWITQISMRTSSYVCASADTPDMAMMAIWLIWIGSGHTSQRGQHDLMHGGVQAWLILPQLTAFASASSLQATAALHTTHLVVCQLALNQPLLQKRLRSNKQRCLALWELQHVLSSAGQHLAVLQQRILCI